MAGHEKEIRGQIMKKSLFPLSSLVLLSLVTAACSTAEKDVKQITDFSFWSAFNTLNVMQDQIVPEKNELDLSIDATRGEVESIQLMITPGADAKRFTISVSDFKSKSGETIDKENIDILVERYIKTIVPSVANPLTAEMFPGYYPDALIPYEKYVKKQENSLYEGENQGIWFNVNIPSDAKPGTYEATITVKIDGGVKDIPFALKVYDLSMTEEMHQMTYYGLWYDYFKRAIHIPLTDSTYENYYWFLAKKRCTPGDLPLSCYRFAGGLPSASQWAEEVVKYAKSNIIPSYNLPCNYVNDPTYGNIVDKEYLEEILAALIEKNIALWDEGDHVDLFRKLYIYAWRATDEPLDNEHEHLRIKKCDKIIVDAKAKLAERLNDYPELKKSFVAIRDVITVSPTLSGFIGDDETGGVQTWCPLVNFFDIDGFKDIMEERKSNPNRVNGEVFWWYNCVSPENPYPSYQVDDNLISSRVMHWMKKDYGVSGNLFWCVNFWRKCVDYSTGLYTDRDVWEDPESFEGVNGDGYLIYPGADYGLDEPIGTLRLESIREGSEDYECLFLFEKEIENINKTHSKSYESDKILRHFYDAIGYGTIPNSSKDFDEQYDIASTFKSNRSELLSLLEKMTNDPESSFDELDGYMKEESDI